MMLILNMLFVGFSGIVAQIIILRELLVNFSGNELTIGIILANWLISEALGVFIIGKLADRVKGVLNLFIALQIVFTLALPVVIYLSRTFKPLIGVSNIEAVPITVVFLASFILILPVAFLHGAMFSCGCKLYSLRSSKDPLGKIYIWETLGTIAGGLALTYLLIPYLNSFQTLFLVSFICTVLTVCLIKRIGTRRLFLIIAVLCYASFFWLPNYLQHASINKQWSGRRVLDYENSHYGNVVVTKSLEQYTFFYNGVPIITTPFADKQFIQDFGNIPVFFNRSPRYVLVLGSGLGGLVNEVLRHPLSRLDYVSIDPLITKMLKKYPTDLSESELSDRRLSIINTDPRLFLRTVNQKYDVVLLGFSDQAELSSNRLFTKEFFFSVKDRLNKDGLIAFWMPGSLTYLGREIKDLNSCVLNSLKRAYTYVRIIPGDYNIYIASDSFSIMNIDADKISSRMKEEGFIPDKLIPGYLKYRLDGKWAGWFNRELSSAAKELNEDLRPWAVFINLELVNKKITPLFANFLTYLKCINLRAIFVFICLITFLFFILIRRGAGKMIPVAYTIFSTGFFGMLANLLLVFSFQIAYGSLYERISLLTVIFMAGTVTGSMFMSNRLIRIKNNKTVLMLLEFSIVVFTLFLGFIAQSLTSLKYDSAVFYYILLFVSGVFMGLEFPLAGKICIEEKTGKMGSISGLLYGSDLIGGWLAGILAGVIFLPILGFFSSCMVLLMLKLSSLILLGTPYRLAQRVSLD